MTANDVKRRLREAAMTFRAWNANQPEVGPKAYGSSWPAIIREAAEAYGYTPEKGRHAVPSPDAISRMDEVFAWLNPLPRDDQKMLWAWANRLQMWQIAQRFGKSERTINYWVNRACGVIGGANRQAA